MSSVFAASALAAVMLGSGIAAPAVGGADVMAGETAAQPAAIAHQAVPGEPTPDEWTDVSKLNIVNVNPRSEVFSVRHGHADLPKPTPSENIFQVGCGNRKDWYRIIRTSDGATWCYATDGEMQVGPLYGNLLCPGNNTGSVLWTYSANPAETDKWSLWRNGYGDYNRCYSFGQNVYIWGVRITR